MTPTNPTNDAVINSYLQYKKGHWRQETARVRGLQVRGIARALAPVALADATEDDLLNWAATFGNAPAQTRASYVSAAHGLFRWMSTRARPRIRPDDPSAILDRPKVPERPPRPMLERRFELALACATSDPEIYAWLGLGGCCGLRCCEIAWMNATDVETLADGSGLLHIQGKGGKYRTVPAGEHMMTVLHPWLVRSRGPVFTRPTDGQPHTPNRVSQILNQFLRGLGIPDTAHSLRHRFGTDYHALDPDLLRQARLMGHTSVLTTQQYTEISPVEASRHVNSLTRQRLHAVGAGHASRDGQVA